MIIIKKIILILLVLILGLTACKSSETLSKGNDTNSIFDQVLKNRESSDDIESNINNRQNMSEADKDSLALNNDNASSASISSWKDLEQLGPIGQAKRSYDDIKEQYPDKTILTITGIIPSDFITDTLNEYLVQNGCNYVVYFHLVDTYYASEQWDIINKDELNLSEENKQLLNELLDNTDIMYLYRNIFFDLSRRGCLEPWSSYLTTEEGKKLYQSMPENNWKSCNVNGEIYGINGRADFVFGPPSYIVNRDLMKKYNITEEDLNKPIYELESILKQVAESEKTNTGFKSVTLGYAEWFNVFDNSVNLNSTAVALYNDMSKKAGSVLDDQENLRWLKSLCQYSNQGLVGKISNRLNEFFIKINMRASLPHMIPDYMFIYNTEGELADSDDVVEIVLDKFYKGCLSSNRLSKHANCIPIASKHKDEAFDFLMRFYTDPYITNLLTYGIENKTYVMKDGKVDWPDIYNLGYGNTYISYPRNYEYADKNERYWKLNEELPYVYYDFVFDPANVKEELEKTNEVMEKVSDILSGNVTDFDAFIADIRKQLSESGLPRLLEEVNRQRDEWINSKKAAKEELK